MSDLQLTIAGVERAHRTLEQHLRQALDAHDLDPLAASRLPSWSVGHVLAHLIGNAESVTNGLAGAAAGRIDQCYPGGMAGRDHDIETRSSWPADELVAQVAAANEQLEATLNSLTPAAWQGTCIARGAEVPVAVLPTMRWREVELHHVDLGLGQPESPAASGRDRVAVYRTQDWPDDFVAAALGYELPLRPPLPDVIADRTPHQQLAWLFGRPASDLAGSWTARTLDPSWRRSFADSEIGDIDRGLRSFQSATSSSTSSSALGAMTTDSFPLNGFGGKLVDLRRRLVVGQGVAAIEGFPVERYNDTELRAIWLAISLHLGTPVPQSRRGDMIGDVRDIGTGISGKAGRGYTSNSELNFHADVCDVSGLFFLKTAQDGGVTRIASSVATHDRLAQRDPDLLRLLYQPMPCSWQSNQTPGEQGWYDMPVFGRVGGETSCAYVRTNITLAHDNAGSPPLQETQRRAVEAVVATASEQDLWIERLFEPGAMLFVHNHTVLHLRTAFVDWEEPARKRHLLRSWLSLPNNRQLPASFGTFFADISAGAVRGGYQPATTEPVFETT